MFTSFVNFNTKLKESTSLGQPITEYDPASSGCKDFMRLARELVGLGSAAGTTVPSLPAALVPSAPSLTPSMPVPMVPVAGRPAVPDENLLERAEALAADANKLLATTETLLGSSRYSKPPRTTPTPAETERKIEIIYGVRPRQDGATFVVKADGALSVRLAGDFNAWNPGMTPMQPLRDGAYQVTLPLGPGRYRYRYVVDGRWMRDPANELAATNPYGELDSVVVVP
jgi:hypothetical protein